MSTEAAGEAAEAEQGGEAARLILRIDENGEFHPVGETEDRGHRQQLREATEERLRGLAEPEPAAEAEAEAEAGGAMGGGGAAGVGLAALLAAAGWVAAALAGVGLWRRVAALDEMERLFVAERAELRACRHLLEAERAAAEGPLEPGTAESAAEMEAEVEAVKEAAAEAAAAERRHLEADLAAHLHAEIEARAALAALREASEAECAAALEAEVEARAEAAQAAAREAAARAAHDALAAVAEAAEAERAMAVARAEDAEARAEAAASAAVERAESVAKETAALAAAVAAAAERADAAEEEAERSHAAVQQELAAALAQVVRVVGAPTADAAVGVLSPRLAALSPRLAALSPPPGDAASPGMGEAWWREFEAAYDRSGATPPRPTGATDASLAPLSARRLVRSLSGAGCRELVAPAKPQPDTGSDKENGGTPRAADPAAPPPPHGAASWSPADSASSADSASCADASPHPASPLSDAPLASPPLPESLPVPPVGGYTPLAAAAATAGAAIAAAAAAGETAQESAAHGPAATAQSSWGSCTSQGRSCISQISEEDSQELWHAMLYDLANIWQARATHAHAHAPATPRACSPRTPVDRHSATPAPPSCESEPPRPHLRPVLSSPPISFHQPFARPACALTDLRSLRVPLAQELRALPGMISQRREAEVRALEALLCHPNGLPAAAPASSHASALAAATAALGRGAATIAAAPTPTAPATPAAASRCRADGAPSPWAEEYVPFTASRPAAASRLSTPAADTRPPPASRAPAPAAELMFADLPASTAAAAAADGQHDPKPPPSSHVAGALDGGAGDAEGAAQRTLPGAFLPAGFEPTSPNTLFGELKKHKPEEPKAEEHSASAPQRAAEPPPPPAASVAGPGMPGCAAGAEGGLSRRPAAEVASRVGAQFALAEARAGAEAEAEAEAEAAQARTAHATVPPEAAAEATAARMHMLIKSLVRCNPTLHPLGTPPHPSAPSPHPLRTPLRRCGCCSSTPCSLRARMRSWRWWSAPKRKRMSHLTRGALPRPPRRRGPATVQEDGVSVVPWGNKMRRG